MSENRELINHTEIPQGQVETSGKIELTDLRKGKEFSVPPEVRTWMQKLEEDPTLNQNNTNPKGDDDSILKPIAPAVVKITLPTDKTTFTGGFSKPVNQAWRWLSEFVLRIIKKNQGKVKFKEE